jgi:ABC-type transport system involved in cytochrome c biogenesis permease subunit
MFVSAIMTMMCTASIAFYVRFLFALYKERQPRSIGYWVRLRLGSRAATISELPERRKPVTRAV